MQQIDEIVPLAYRSLESRATLGLSSAAPLGARQLAAHLGIRVWTPDDVPGLSPDARKVLLRNDGTPNCWSALTLVVGEKSVGYLELVAFARATGERPDARTCSPHSQPRAGRDEHLL